MSGERRQAQGLVGNQNQNYQAPQYDPYMGYGNIPPAQPLMSQQERLQQEQPADPEFQ